MKGLALSVTTLAMLLPSPAPADAAQSRDCGQMPNHFAYNIEARNVLCGKARRVVRRWSAPGAQAPGGDGRVLGFYCDYRSTGYEAGRIRCSRGKRVIRWQTGS